MRIADENIIFMPFVGRKAGILHRFYLFRSVCPSNVDYSIKQAHEDSEKNPSIWIFHHCLFVTLRNRDSYDGEERKSEEHIKICRLEGRRLSCTCVMGIMWFGRIKKPACPDGNDGFQTEAFSDAYTENL